MNRVIFVTTLVAAGFMGPGLAHDPFDPDARSPAWHQSAPLRPGGEREHLLIEGRYEIYDAQGRRTGRAEED